MSEKQVIPYKETVFTKFKNRIMNWLKRKDNINNNLEQNVTNKSDEKQEVMKLYELIKNEEVDLNSVDTDKLYKIMLLLNEEIKIVNDKINSEINGIKDQLQKINEMYKN